MTQSLFVFNALTHTFQCRMIEEYAHNWKKEAEEGQKKHVIEGTGLGFALSLNNFQ